VLTKKQNANARKKFIQIQMIQVTVMRYPGLFVHQFTKSAILVLNWNQKVDLQLQKWGRKKKL